MEDDDTSSSLLFGPFYYARHGARTRPFSKSELVTRLRDSAPARLAGVAVYQVNDSDGVKYLLADDSWLLVRPSGTEPVLRIYAEARSPERVQALLEAGARLAGL